jgi:hypothetical protein
MIRVQLISAYLFCPHRLAWPRTLPFQGSNTGSNPVGDTRHFPGPVSTGRPRSSVELVVRATHIRQKDDGEAVSGEVFAQNLMSSVPLPGP